MNLDEPALPAILLGIEGGGTRTVALWVDKSGNLIHRVESGPANARLCSDAQLRRRFREIARCGPRPAAICIGLAGAREAADWRRIESIAAAIWPGVPCRATNDLETALAAGASPPGKLTAARVLVLSGTGSCCYGRNHAGKTAKIGGWGHILGDKGSGYEIGLRALKAVVYYGDRDGRWPALGARLLRVLQLNEPNELIGWVQRAEKSEVAALATEVFAAWGRRDVIATDILTGAAHSLAKDAAACARRIASRGARVQFVLSGSVLLKQPRFASLVETQLRNLWPSVVVTPLSRESAWGAVEMAKYLHRETVAAGEPTRPRVSQFAPSRAGLASGAIPAAMAHAFAASPTEKRNPRSRNLDRMSVDEIIRLMLGEDAKIPAALLGERKKIARAVRMIEQSFQNDGRLFYVGAGTSGRLGVLDASECPPTFRTPPEQVQGIIAGGQCAIWQAVEGAEDSAPAGARAVEFRGVRRGDAVVGIAASGRTPFVWGALRAAKKRGAKAVLLCFNPAVARLRGHGLDMILAPDIGPEILTGSTRLKSGTATKLLLNIFTTATMVRGEKVISNLMVDLNPSNVKLRDRAIRILRDLTGADTAACHTALEKSKWVVKDAWLLLRASGSYVGGN